MKQLRNNVIRAGLDALYYTGAHRMLRPLLAGVGSIFMLHHVRPARDDMFQPNRHLEITPNFLREVLAHVRSLGVDIVSMDEAHRRMHERDFSRRFACFTFDDGYRDNRDHALPVMREYKAPFTVYVASDFAEGPDGFGGWRWSASSPGPGPSRSSGTARPFDSRLAIQPPSSAPLLRFTTGCAPSRRHRVQRAVSDLCARHGVDDAAIARELCMSWNELKPFAGDPS
jgi:hypothetical protein